MPTSNRRPTADGIYDALADERRRLVLRTVAGADDPVDRETIASDLAERTGVPVETLAASLHHAHLPKLDRAGLVRYDPTAGTVTPVVRSGDAFRP